MKLPIRLIAAALPLLLAACVHKETVRPPAPKADFAALLDQQRAREHLLAKTDHWVLQGKIGVSGPVNGKSEGGSGPSFAALLKDAVGSVLEAGKKSDAQTVAAAAGKANVMDVVTAVAETDVAVSTLVSVRDRVIQSYEDIMRMPI